MKLPNAAHESHPWRIHEFTDGFRLEDVWELPVEGERAEFERFVRLVASYDPVRSSSPVVRALFGVRLKIGDLLGWDDRAAAAAGSDAPTLRDRLPMDLRHAPPGPEFGLGAFTSLYLIEDEWAAEAVNETVHGVIHFGWVPQDGGGYRAQMAIYVKPNGLLGRAYMAAITPFRYLLVYPALLSEIGREWRTRHGAPPATAPA